MDQKTDFKDRVFTYFPEWKRKRIVSTETEYGIELIQKPSEKERYWRDLQDSQKSELIDTWVPKKPGFIKNGGRIYNDCCHVEFACPESNGPLEAMIYEIAGDLICSEGGGDFPKIPAKLFRHNHDWNGHSFASHENYFTSFPISEMERLRLFLETRQIIDGSGNLNNRGYQISQKPPFIEHLISYDTVNFKSLINTREEDHASVKGWRRHHMTLGDSNMCEIARFVKLASTTLIFDLAEDGLLPKIEDRKGRSLANLHEISEKGPRYVLEGLPKKHTAIDIQRIYLEAAKRYKGRDETTDLALNWWEHILDTLDSDDTSPLIGVLDYKTKEAWIDLFVKAEGLDITKQEDREIVRSVVDQEYHNIDRENGIFWAEGNLIKRLVSPELVLQATQRGSSNTRADTRSSLIRLVQEGKLELREWNSGGNMDWEHCQVRLVGETNWEEINLPDPNCTYGVRLNEILSKEKFNFPIRWCDTDSEEEEK